MENEDLIPDSPQEMDAFDREERCRRVIKQVAKAILMRLVAAVLLVWALFQTKMEPWVWGLMGFALLIILSGLLPLGMELKKQRKLLKEILAEEE